METEKLSFLVAAFTFFSFLFCIWSIRVTITPRTITINIEEDGTVHVYSSPLEPIPEEGRWSISIDGIFLPVAVVKKGPTEVELKFKFDGYFSFSTPHVVIIRYEDNFGNNIITSMVLYVP